MQEFVERCLLGSHQIKHICLLVEIDAFGQQQVTTADQLPHCCCFCKNLIDHLGLRTAELNHSGYHWHVELLFSPRGLDLKQLSEGVGALVFLEGLVELEILLITERSSI